MMFRRQVEIETRRRKAAIGADLVLEREALLIRVRQGQKASLTTDGGANVRQQLRHGWIDCRSLPVGSGQREKIDSLDTSGGIVLKHTALRVRTHDRSISDH